MKKDAILFYGLVVFVGLVIVVGAKAADNEAVTATVTVQNISVSLSQSSFDYGTMASNTASSTLQMFGGVGIVATNNGNVVEDFDINGADTASWALAGTTGSDQYVHQFCNDTDNDCSNPPTSYVALTTSPAELDTAISASGDMAFQLRLTTPNPSTVFTQQSASVTITASAN